MARTHSLRSGQATDALPPDVYIPDRLYFRIGEVSELTRTKPYVLRFWETEFPSLKPVKSKSGHRLYRRQDVQAVLQIRHLLYGKGFTIPGARQHLAADAKAVAGQRHLFQPKLDTAELRAIRHELQSVLTILSRKC